MKTISVIVPTAGRPKDLARLLGCLRGQEFDGSFETLVVDDRSESDGKLPAPQGDCKVLRGEGKGPARARNLGVVHSTGTYLLFLDDDAAVDRGYLARILKEIEARPGHAISGIQVSGGRRNVFSLAAEWMHHIFVKDESRDSRSKFAASNGLTLRRVDFDRCGGFDPHFPLAAGEDREFCVRWLAAGFHISVLKGAAIEHQFPETFASLASQQWRYGRGAFHFQQRVQSGQRLRVRGARYYLRMLTEAPRRYGPLLGTGVGILSWICQGIVAGGYLRERVRPASTGKGAELRGRIEEARAD